MLDAAPELRLLVTSQLPPEPEGAEGLGAALHDLAAVLGPRAGRVQETLGRRVALKVLPQARLLSGHQLQRFQREAHVAASLHHTHIVPVFDSGQADGYHYYAMQFIDGRGLDAVVRYWAGEAVGPTTSAFSPTL